MPRFVQISDIHFGAANPKVLQSVTERIKALAPDALLVCGDLTQRGRKTEFHAAQNWLEQFAMPMIVVPGNHDTPWANAYARTIQPFRRFKRNFEKVRDTITVDGITVVGINTARGWQLRRNWAEGSVDLKELDLALNHSPPPSILVCHHPLLPFTDIPMPTRTARGLAASRRVAASTVGLVLTGHVHVPTVARIEYDVGSYIAAGSGTVSTRLRNHPPHFNLIEMTGDGAPHITGQILRDTDWQTSELTC